ncbi:proliferating cell nuclear antigen PCNA [Cryptosporidium andersoni]|uniref:DNA sliding clamp PCNA n=1 Tax=Cryptosporidium andersoni TaxID=117008 RepID=A0A1J4MV66_9CRYT|nr:proliferating cell nuclear antigen PCNA [Cryptosporidium andersoni]
MFEARLSSGGILKRVFEAITNLVTDVNLECNESGITIQAMDNSHVSLVALYIKDIAFERYRCDRSRTLGLNTQNVVKLLKLCSSDDQVLLRHDDDSESLIFIFETPNGDRISEFELTLISIDQDSLQIPETSFSSIVSMPSNEFQRLCRDMAQFSDSLSIDINRKNVRFFTKGSLGLGSVVLRPKDGADTEAVALDVTEPCQLVFSLRYLNNFAKATPLSNSVKLSMSENQPLELEYSLEGSGSGYLRFYLARKITEDEEQE